MPKRRLKPKFGHQKIKTVDLPYLKGSSKPALLSADTGRKYKFLERISKNKWSPSLTKEGALVFPSFSVCFFSLGRFFGFGVCSDLFFSFLAFVFQFSAEIQAVFRIWYPMRFSVFPKFRFLFANFAPQPRARAKTLLPRENANAWDNMEVRGHAFREKKWLEMH